LYLISRGIRERLAGEFGSLSQEQITEITTNLSLVETAMLRDRETLLNQGVRFDQLDLTDPRFSHYFNDVIQGEGAQGKIGAALRFASAVKEDFGRSGDAYWDEFIFKREYKHGFVLWSGDAPIDEFDTAALGPSGGFARRARDNENQAKAAGKELQLLDAIATGGAVTPEQVATGLVDIYKTIAIYDPGKAKRIIMEKYIGIARFFAADSLIIIPGVGDVLGMTRQSSFARMMYGNDMPAWQAMDTRIGSNILRNRLQLKPDEIREMEQALFAAKSDVAVEFAVTMAKLMTIALLIYLGTKVLNEKEGGKH
jgi:hypothetical protein